MFYTLFEISLPISEKVWILKIQQSNQKLWLSEVCGASINALSRFSWYLSRYNSDFNPWIAVGIRIWSSTQWRRFKSVLTARSKLGFLGPLRIDFRSNLVKVVKNLWEAQVWCKTIKKLYFVRVRTTFDLWSNLGLIRAILVILAKKALQVLQCSNGLRHVILDVLMVP